jgi:hypothetical protein
MQEVKGSNPFSSTKHLAAETRGRVTLEKERSPNLWLI